jgi:hypothetical protein
MFITLTNASPAYPGEPILINFSLVVSMWRGKAVRGMDDEGAVTSTEEVTFIFVPPHGTWEVKDSIEEIQLKLSPNPDK